MNIALILSGGVGNRFGADMPKQYLEIAGRKIVEYVICAALKAGSIDRVVVAAAPPYEHLLPIWEKHDFDLTPSGAERNETIRLGLDFIKANYDCKNIAVIDSARPLTTPDLIDALMEKLDTHVAAIQARRISDSLGRYGHQDVDRSEYYIIQTPECFHFDLFYEHFRTDAPATCLLNHLPPDADSFLYFDFIDNLKMTYPSDLDFLEYMLKKRRGAGI